MVGRIRTLLIVVLAFAAGLPIRSYGQSEASAGAVFVMTNSAFRNEIVVYRRNPDGSLQEGSRFSTGGRGSGGLTDPLGSQGSLTLTSDRSFLLAVNAASGTISVFRVQGVRLSLLDRIPSGGSEPVAVAQHGSIVYVVNAGGTSSVVGFRLESSGKLRPIEKSTSFLTTANSGAASLAFSPDGQFLLVTEKLTNSVDVFRIRADGTLGAISPHPSVGPGLFAVVFAPNGTVITTETGPAGGTNASAVSSYAVLSSGGLSPISASVPALGAATCWQVITPDGRFVYTSNAGSSSISGFSIGANGGLTPLTGTVLATQPANSVNLDIAISANGKFLYTLNSGTGTVGIFAINSDGSLTGLGEVGGLSASDGLNGIAAM